MRGIGAGMATSVGPLVGHRASARQSGSGGQDCGWETTAPLPAAQSDAAGTVAEGQLYYLGGFTSGIEIDPVARAYRFDPSAGEDGRWDRIADMPRAVWGACGVAADGTVYSFGGAPGSPYDGDAPSDAILRYEPGAGWTDLTATRDIRCPYPTWGMRGAYNPADGLIYCVGGGTDVTDRESASHHGGAPQPGTFDERRLWTFDPAKERVADPDRARMQQAKRWASVALVSVEDRPCLHAIAGRLGGSGPTNTNYRYDLEREEWSELTPAPLTGNYGTNSNPVVDNAVYLTHGISLAGDLSLDSFALVNHRYDPVEDAFATDTATPAHPRTGPVDAVIDGRLHVVGGHVKRYDRDGEHQCLTRHEVFTPTPNCADG